MLDCFHINRRNRGHPPQRRCSECKPFCYTFRRRLPSQDSRRSCGNTWCDRKGRYSGFQACNHIGSNGTGVHSKWKINPRFSGSPPFPVIINFTICRWIRSWGSFLQWGPFHEGNFTQWSLLRNLHLFSLPQQCGHISLRVQFIPRRRIT